MGTSAASLASQQEWGVPMLSSTCELFSHLILETLRPLTLSFSPDKTSFGQTIAYHTQHQRLRNIRVEINVPGSAGSQHVSKSL